MQIIWDKIVDSECGYSPSYSGFLPIEEQIMLVAERHNLNPEKALAYAQKEILLPNGAEGLIAMPYLLGDNYAYGNSLKAFCNTFSRQRELKIECLFEEDWLFSRNRLFGRTRCAFVSMRKAQDSDILVFPAQAGIFHRGESTICAANKIVASTDGEFCGDAIMGMTILLNNPGLVSKSTELQMDFPGSEYCCNRVLIYPEHKESLALLYVEGGTIHLRYRDNLETDKGYGSVSGFLPVIAR